MSAARLAQRERCGLNRDFLSPQSAGDEIKPQTFFFPAKITLKARGQH